MTNILEKYTHFSRATLRTKTFQKIFKIIECLLQALIDKYKEELLVKSHIDRITVIIRFIQIRTIASL